MFEYQKNRRYFAQVAGGIEALAARELTALGASSAEIGYRGVHFNADPAVLYHINYNARLVSRILAPLVSFRCRDREDLYRAGRSVDWGVFFPLEETFGIFANVSGNERLRHSRFAALCLKDAVADGFRSRTGKRPNVDPLNPGVWLNLFVEGEKGIISLDTSGGSLHRRGYRRETVEAPMRETLAAAMAALSEWRGERPLHDPMCGSGTLLCEAMMAICRIPSGFLRPRFGFQYLPDFKASLWNRVKRAADDGMIPLKEGLVSGGDNDKSAVRAARINCSLLPGGDRIRVHHRDYNDLSSLENRTILCNPPYGIRMKPEADLGLFFKAFGDFLKQRCKGSTALIYFGNREMIKKIGLKPTWKKPMRNAGLDGRAARYDLY
ncbi:THUMP domain-containing class I SAM-dependent RNA methyltransferase [Desulfococcus multivorans]|uniref:RNA methylase n=1 Tax=Desulfococcus multivorans DSM 2059 TaxID=1121405 RepID=S7TWS5_DESML|nr:THUMP domain-containing protein [Desulfococcus multivorans]AQV00904.1 RNA methyltransferase [Desulfococcus multivorans]EPR41547.1 RNA methylase [Desulfococcus multivorans DSM 2059]SJZ44474.1 putative N6-adenine-specific DNA methylase [Desulfococcus multivorans DSM 2059]